MADEPNTEALDEAQPGPARPREDLLLTALVVMANDHGGQVTVTLSVGGAAVSGNLVGRDVWLEALANRVSGSGAGFLGLLTEEFKMDGVRSADPDWQENYVHLVDARFLTGSAPWPELSTPGTLWRGRLGSVDGWAWGRLGA